ncbi:MAG TPA: DUF5668 domain-containing protein [Thermoanaerobaculia bacterium]|nr:DUF5668 domain-containing protein [Thermoanaerobaculia bacterium]
MNSVRLTPKLIAGLAILTLGLLWTLDNVLHVQRFALWWPVVLIVAGLARFFDPAASKFGSAILMIAGTLLLLNNLDRFDLDFSDLFPLFIAVVGGKLVWDAITRRSARLATSDPDSTFSAFAMMAGVKRQSVSQEFRGGDASAIMGGVEIDLRSANVRDGEVAEIDTFAMWGGIEIRVPENWRVVGKVLPLMGGFDDKTRPTGTGPTLVVKGVAVMGAVEVKN